MGFGRPFAGDGNGAGEGGGFKANVIGYINAAGIAGGAGGAAGGGGCPDKPPVASIGTNGPIAV